MANDMQVQRKHEVWFQNRMQATFIGWERVYVPTGTRVLFDHEEILAKGIDPETLSGNIPPDTVDRLLEIVKERGDPHPLGRSWET